MKMIRIKPLAAMAVVLACFTARANNEVIDATHAGVVADGTTLNTVAIQKAIDECSASGGGTIHFGAGRYLTGTIQLKSHVTLHLDDDAVLLGSPDAADYRNLDSFTDGSGHPLGHALVVAVDADHVAIEGPGTIDGQGLKLKAKQKPFTIRPFLVRFVRCTNVTTRDVHLVNPGAWTLNFFQAKDATIDHVTIRSRDEKLINNDGINIDSSENIQVKNCDVISGDDALVIKSTSATPSRNITAENCKLSTGTNAIKLGTESYGGFENVSVSHCQITNTQMAGIALCDVDGGDLHNIKISDITMDSVGAGICVRLGSRLKTFRQGESPKPVGQLHDVTIQNVSAKNIATIGILMNGIPNHPIENITLDNVDLSMPGGGTAEAAQIKLAEKEAAYPEYNMFGKTFPASATYIRHARNIKFENVKTTTQKPDARPAIVEVDVKDSQISAE